MALKRARNLTGRQRDLLDDLLAQPHKALNTQNAA